MKLPNLKAGLQTGKERVREVGASINKHKREVAVGGIIIVANAMAGTIFVDTVVRVNELQKRQEVLEKVTDALIVEDVATTRALCENEGLSYAALGLPVTPELIETTCGDREQRQLEYWRGVIKDAIQGGNSAH